MQLHTYLALAGLSPADWPLLHQAGFAAEVQAQQDALAQALRPEALADLTLQWQYRVPELGEGGSCSLFGQLADAPQDLARVLGGTGEANTRLLQPVTAVVRHYQAHSRSHWFGVYQRRLHEGQAPVLLKLAYYGAESRAEFPLTPEFALGSNNSAVGLSGQGRIINDVPAYVAQGGEYYTCDPKVMAEACLPVFGPQGELVGIIDSEAFERGFFLGTELALLLAVVCTLSNGLLAQQAGTALAA